VSLLPPTGVVILDKPKGLTSRKAAEYIGRLAGAERQGHVGTLDPLATGVLVVCLDRATLLARFLGAGTKEYEVTALLGFSTDTYDIDGQVVATGDASQINLKDLKAGANEFTGEKKQIPPDYSAVKLQGRPLYEYARARVPVDAPPRFVKIHKIDVLSVKELAGKKYVSLAVTCDPGTYIRTLINDLGELLGCMACVSDLRRIRNGAFTVEDSVTIDDIDSGATSVFDSLLTVEEATRGLPGLVVSAEGSTSVSQGKPLQKDWITSGQTSGTPGYYRVTDERGTLLAIYGPPRPGDDAEVRGRAERVIRPYNKPVN